MDAFTPAVCALPKLLAKHKYHEPTNPLDAPFQLGQNTTLRLFDWMSGHPYIAKDFNNFMAFRRQGKPSWLDIYPVEEAAHGWNPNKPFFVDVGGGIGHQCIALKERFPYLPGQVVVQDIECPIDSAFPSHGIKPMAHDFFKPQSVKGIRRYSHASCSADSQLFLALGARLYFLGTVLHDWPDKECEIILGNLAAVMSFESRILLDEQILPNQSIDWRATQIDLYMLSGLAATERTEAMWTGLVDCRAEDSENLPLRILDTLRKCSGAWAERSSKPSLRGIPVEFAHETARQLLEINMKLSRALGVLCERPLFYEAPRL